MTSPATQPEPIAPPQARPTRPAPRRAPPAALPPRSPWLVRWFLRYGRRYVARNFHAVRLLRHAAPAPFQGRPVIIAMNHPAWWDPMIALVAATHFFPDRTHFAAIDAAAVDKYRFFTRLGFFGVERGSPRGARAFLRHGRAIAALPDAALWVTAQGAFTDARVRPVEIEPGVAHLAHHSDHAPVVLPMAIEYAFWTERYPEALLAFGDPVDPAAHPDAPAEDLNRAIARSLSAAMDALADASRRRATPSFDTILRGSAGVGGVYDLWRRGRARLRGERFDPSHGGNP